MRHASYEPEAHAPRAIAEARGAAARLGSDPRWKAIVERDGSADGQFYYSVETTGVYCRPGCGSRLPKPHNVRLHASTADAESAGFRPCKRCKPNQPSGDPSHAAIVAAACRTIETAENPPSLDALARSAGFSPYHFHRLFKAATGLTPRAYAVAHRSRKVRETLLETDRVLDAIYDSGFGSGSRFYAQAESILGMAPSTYRKGGAKEIIHFATGPCSLGTILVAASDKGVCAILLGDDPGMLRRDLQARFRDAELVGADPAFATMVERVVRFVEAPQIGLNLPMDIRGTAFQHRVWQALAAIPPGGTASYQDVATAIGAPNATRAVAQACGANMLAVAIPCHRVVRSDGALSGYRWGVDRKRSLLDREAAEAERPSTG